MTAAGELPPWQQVLVVVAHPDDESFGLGSVIAAFTTRGADVDVLCLTRGEASTLHGVDGGPAPDPADLAVLRESELREAGRVLGVRAVQLLDRPDGRLTALPAGVLAGDVATALEGADYDGILAFDPSGVSGHPDHAAATAAAVDATDLPVLVWTLDAGVADRLNRETGGCFTGHEQVDILLPVDRTRQRAAVACHPSQAVPSSVLWRRMELCGEHERLRWARPPVPVDAG